MEPIVNLEETPGKVVGRRRPPSDALSLAGETRADMEAWHRAFRAASLPRGVYRFRTHEEADTWLWRMIARPRKKS